MKHAVPLKISAVLWVVWGLVHILAGVMTITQDASGSVQGIADAIDPQLLAMNYPPAAEAILNQHGWNLAWIGLTTTISAFWIWRSNLLAAFLACLVGGLADVGYFLYIDLGGFSNFVPGTIMTIVSGAAVLLTCWAAYQTRHSTPSPDHT